MVDACTVGGGGRSLECEVPFEKVGFKRCSVESWIWVNMKLSGFFENAFYRGRFGIECWKRHDIANEINNSQCFSLLISWSHRYKGAKLV